MKSKQLGTTLIRIFRLTAIYVVLSLTIILNIISIRPALNHLLDFGSFIAAGKETVMGKNPYTVDLQLVYVIESRRTDQSLPSPNLNPPLSILFFTPLSDVDPIQAVSSWRIVTAILFGVGVFILASFYPKSRKLKRILWAISLAGFWNIIVLGQIYAPILILAIGVWMLTEREYHKLAGLALGFIIAIKPNFAFWLLMLGAAGYVTSALIAAIVALSLSILPVLIFGPEVFKQWLAALSNYPSIGLLIAGNTSFQSLAARFGSALPGMVISLLFISGSLYFTYRHQLSLSKINSLGIVGSLLISPFSWAGYTILTLPIFFSRSQWNWQYKLSAAMLSIPYILVMYFFQKSLFHSVLFGWLYGWGLLLILSGLILNKDDKSPKHFHFTEADLHVLVTNESMAQLAGLPSPVIQSANEIMAELEKTSGRAVKIDPHAAQQAMLFPESSPLLEELKELDVNSLSPIEALNKLFEWQKKFTNL